jgi:hypothetical protein
LMMCEPLRGWRHVKVTQRRTRRDYAECVRDEVDPMNWTKSERSFATTDSRVPPCRYRE